MMNKNQYRDRQGALFLLLIMLVLFLSSCHKTDTKQPSPNDTSSETPVKVDYASTREIWDTAIKLAESAPDLNTRTLCYSTITSNLLTIDRIDDAQSVANKIETDWERIQTLGEISQYAIGKTKIEEAKKILDEMLPIIRTLSNPMEKISAYTMVSVQLNQLGDKEKDAAIQLEKKVALDEMKKNPPSESTTENQSQDLLDLIELKIEHAKSLADEGNILDSIASLGEIDDPAAESLALAYIALTCIDDSIPIGADEKSALSKLLEPKTDS